MRVRGLILRTAAAAALCLVRATALAALQFGGTVDLGTGQAAWDQLDTDGALTQGALGASYRAGALLGLEPELLGNVGLSSDPAERTAVRWDVGGRLHTRGERTGAWLGAAFGRAGVGVTSALTRIEGGLRQVIGPAGVHVWMSRTSFGSHPLGGKDLGQADDTLSGVDSVPGRRIAEYTDLGTRATLGLGSYEVGFSLVRRMGGTGIRRTAWEASAVWWLAPSLGLVGAAGHSLPQFGLAVPGARYGTLGVRVTLGAPPRRGRHRSPEHPVVAAAGTPRLVVATQSRIAIVGPPASHAEVMGDFTDWEPRPLAPDGPGRWTMPVALSPGVHHLNVRFDGGEWTVPEGTAAVEDGFGGKVGLFVVR